MKSRLEDHDIHERIAFAKVNPGDHGCVSYVLVYNANISVAEAVADAYRLGSNDKYEEVAMLLRVVIQEAFKKSKSLPWPPTVDDLDIDPSESLLPSELMQFLNLFITGEADTERSDKDRRIVLSIGQVIVFPLSCTLCLYYTCLVSFDVMPFLDIHK